MANFEFYNVDTVKLAEKYGTPLYVVSEDHIVNKCKEIQEDFIKKYKNVRAVYASKAFLNKEMCRIIDKEGLGIDVVSGGELYVAMQAGFPMEKIIFHGNNKTINELEMAIDNNVGRIVVDNFYELDLLNSITTEKEKKIQILFRVTPGVDSHTHEYISTGQIDSKFGIPISDDMIYDAVSRTTDMKYVEFKGFHFHVGSQLLENTSHLMALETLVTIMKRTEEELGLETRELNVGGGFGIYYSNGDDPKPLRYFTDAIMEALILACEKSNLLIPEVIIEPGRWIIGEAGITLYSIGSIKEIPNVRTYVGVDGGMPDNPRTALYQAKYEAVIANKINEEKNDTVTIAGKCCESGDILIWDLKVPRLAPGDILAVKSTGAYNYSMASNYNKIPRPAVVMIKDGEDRLTVRRETYEDLIARNL
ncbi:diaminopimelate decarboxylase [Wukongibacter baidiensis]|uniref:diaminopimelate decarboxylase n=1 Tax=Wukongibacter baidiensis TaxID=1723361 RepID=UPI003D7FE9D6